ncbi:MAG: hypothetical protein WC592_00190 [Candidatus Omnitrophota bacterium]|nr:hypothetical protein [Candidatus Omnitrophota bacterium]
MKMRSIAIAATVLVLGSCCFFSVEAAIGKTPESARDEAITDLNLAIRLVKQAQEMLSGKMSKETVEAAIGLYVQAGQLFEKSENIFKALGPQYVPQSFVDNCAAYKNECVQTIMRFRKGAGQ